jgi:hypothetical protein
MIKKISAKQIIKKLVAVLDESKANDLVIVADSSNGGCIRVISTKEYITFTKKISEIGVVIYVDNFYKA